MIFTKLEFFYIKNQFLYKNNKFKKTFIYEYIILNIKKMPIYYATVFYPDIAHKERIYFLSALDQSIEKEDVERGYVLREEFLDCCKITNVIKESDINIYSRVVEYRTDTKNNNMTPEITIILPIK